MVAKMWKTKTNRRLLWAVGLVALVVATAVGAGQTLSVQVKAGQIRNAPSFLAPVVAALDYGTRVEALAEQNGWTQVRAATASGWIHTSALTAKPLALAAGKTDAAQNARSDELALAGKGFNREVEGQYRSQTGGAGYAWIDRMEQINLPAAQLTDFLQQGGVTPQGGAQ